MDKMIFMADLCDMLNISPSTVARWEDDGILPRRVVIRAAPDGRPLSVGWWLSEVLEALKRLPRGTPKWPEKEKRDRKKPKPDEPSPSPGE